MPSNTTLDAGTGGDIVVTKERTHDGDAAKQQGVFISGVTGSEGSYTFTDVTAGGGTEATALRVTVASDSTGVLSVDDNGASLTVDNAALSVTGGGVEASALRVTIASDSTGVLSVGDNGGSLTVDNAGLTELAAAINASSQMDVNIAASGATVPVSNAGLTELAAAINGSSQMDVNLAASNATVTVSNATLTNAHSADFDTGAGTDTTPAFGIAVPASGGAVVIPGDATAGLKVDLGADNDVTVTGTVTANLAAGTNNIGDVDILSIAAGDNNIGNVDIVSLPASTNTIEVVGDAAHDAGIAGNPVRIAGRALTASYTAVATGDTADLITTTIGQLVEIPYSIPENTWSYAAASGGITNTTGVTAVAAGGAGLRRYITRVQVINGHATVSTDVQIRDGAAGTVLWRGFAQAAGGGVSAVFDPPLRGTANTLVEVACGTTGSATYFNLQGFTAP